MALVLDPATGLYAEDGKPAQPGLGILSAGAGISGRNAPRPQVVPPVVAPTPAPARTRGQGPQPARPAPLPAPGLPTGPQGRNVPPAAVGLAAAAQPTPVTTPSATLTQPTPSALTASQVGEQDRANLVALVSSQPDFVGPAGGPQGTTLSPDILADANQRIARTLAESRTVGPQPGAERGDFNLATTSRVSPGGEITSTLRQPTNIIEGGYGGFGGGRGTAFLQQMAQQDQQDAAVARERRREAQEGVERIGLRNAMTQGTPQERRAARQQLEALDQRAGLRLSETGATARQGMQLQGDILRAETAGAAGIQAAQARAAGLQQAAETAGRFGLQRAETTALGRVAAAQESTRTGANALAAQRARQLAIQEELLRQAQAAGDVSGTFAAAGLSRPPTQEYIDPLTGAPLSPEQVRLLQQQALSRLDQQQ